MATEEQLCGKCNKPKTGDDSCNCGRPTKYTDELALEICTKISGGLSLKKTCELEGMPNRLAVHIWLVDGKHKEFAYNYEKACNIRAENMADALEEIADISDKEESPMRSRLRVDTRKWYLSKIMPKKYGDKLDLTSDYKPIQAPLLAKINNNVRDNDSDNETVADEEKN